MQGLQVSGVAKTREKVWEEDFIMYSAMSHKPLPLVTVGSDDKVSCTRHVAHFWAVMLVGRDTTEMVNMAPYTENYVIPHAVAKSHGSLRLGSKLEVNILF